MNYDDDDKWEQWSFKPNDEQLNQLMKKTTLKSRGDGGFQAYCWDARELVKQQQGDSPTLRIGTAARVVLPLSVTDVVKHWVPCVLDRTGMYSKTARVLVGPAVLEHGQFEAEAFQDWQPRNLKEQTGYQKRKDEKLYELRVERVKQLGHLHAPEGDTILRDSLMLVRSTMKDSIAIVDRQVLRNILRHILLRRPGALDWLEHFERGLLSLFWL